jgi:hypothetical protein
VPCGRGSAARRSADKEQFGEMVKIEGHSLDELLALPAGDLDTLVLAGRPIVARIGTASVLAECRRAGDALIVDLAHIDGGGEGALPTLSAFVEGYARSRGCTEIRWAVRATNCAKPNEKLKRVLVRRGFATQDVPELGECFYRVTAVRPARTV